MLTFKIKFKIKSPRTAFFSNLFMDNKMKDKKYPSNALVKLIKQILPI
jgi:hypothetical protein